MNKAKNSLGLVCIAGLTLLLCCVASAGPTYSFVKIAGEWAFYAEEPEGLNSDLEVTASQGQQIKLARRNEAALAENDPDMSLPAVGSIVNLTSADDSSGQGAPNASDQSRGNGSGSGGNKSLLNGDSAGNVTIASDAYPGASSYLVQSTLDNGFENPDLKNANFKNGGSNTPNGNAWGYWKNKDANEDIASPVPVPVPGSIFLAAIGAGIVKLLHDRRVSR